MATEDQKFKAGQTVGHAEEKAGQMTGMECLGVVYVLTVLVCMGSSILGMYVKVLGVSKAAFIHSKM